MYSWPPMLRPICKGKKRKNRFFCKSSLNTILCESTVSHPHGFSCNSGHEWVNTFLMYIRVTPTSSQPRTAGHPDNGEHRLILENTQMCSRLINKLVLPKTINLILACVTPKNSLTTLTKSLDDAGKMTGFPRKSLLHLVRIIW